MTPTPQPSPNPACGGHWETAASNGQELPWPSFKALILCFLAMLTLGRSLDHSMLQNPHL